MNPGDEYMQDDHVEDMIDAGVEQLHALKATIDRVKELRDRWYRTPGMSEEADALDAALDG